MEEPEKWHGSGPFDLETGKSIPADAKSPPKYQDVFGCCLAKLAQSNKNIVGITAAMPSGTGLDALQNTIPERFHDVGIAEEHAVLLAAGMATQGLSPVCAIYSTFLQRAYDPIIHDVCLQELPVTFASIELGSHQMMALLIMDFSIYHTLGAYRMPSLCHHPMKMNSRICCIPELV